jgi:hypothetical protein
MALKKKSEMPENAVVYMWIRSDTAVILKDVFRIWLEENNIEYSLNFESGTYLDTFSLTFEDIKDAMFFKLSWIGNE